MIEEHELPEIPEPLRGQAVSVHEMLFPGDSRFRAPEFQRHYVWRAGGKSNEIGRFWDDVDRLRDEGVSETGLSDSLFMGAIVLQVNDPGGPGRTPLYAIIDGQQRLTTLYLVFTALAEAFQDVGQADTAADIERQYLLVQASKHRDHPRLEPTVSDTAQFYEIISCLKNPQPTLPRSATGSRSGIMVDAWQAIRGRVRQVCADDEDATKLSEGKLNQLHEDIGTRIDLVSITLGTRHDPHEVYERLNNDGKPLGTIDLVRNAVFLTAGHDASDTEKIYVHWDKFENNLSSNGKLDAESQNKYFFPYGLIRDQGTTKGSLYRSLKSYWEGKVTFGERSLEAAEAIVRDLNEYLPAYRAIVGEWGQAPLDPVSATLERLRGISPPEMMYPFLMQLLHEYLQGELSANEVSDSFDVIDSLIVRRSFSGLTSTGMHATFKSLWKSVAADPKKMTRSLDDRKIQFPNDAEFRECVLNASIARSRNCRYILTEYERSFDVGDPSKWNPQSVTVDHLLPQTYRPLDWPGVTAEGHEAVVDTFANLVPLSAQANALKSNRSWEETRKIMTEQSGTVFKSTRAVFDEYDHWDLDTIADRAEKLADWALKRWPKASY